MAKEVKITCDGCGKDLTTTGNLIDYRLALVVEVIKSWSGSVTNMMVYPPIDGDRYFCGVRCLERWLTKRAGDNGNESEERCLLEM